MSKFFKYSLVYAVLNFILLCWTEHICLDKYIPTYFITSYIVLTIIYLYEVYKTFKRIYYRPTCNLLQASVIASLGNTRASNAKRSINRCLKSQFGRKSKYNAFHYRRKI